MREAIKLMREAIKLMREAIKLMREAINLMREAIKLMREAITRTVVSTASSEGRGFPSWRSSTTTLFLDEPRALPPVAEFASRSWSCGPGVGVSHGRQSEGSSAYISRVSR